MIKSFLLVPAALALALSAVARDLPVLDARDRPLYDSFGAPLFYTEDDIPDPFEESAAFQPPSLPQPLSIPQGISAATTTPWTMAPSPGGSPFWSYAMFGTQIGDAGMLPVSTPAGTELFVSATANQGFWPNNFWYVLRYHAATANYQQVFVHPPYAELSSYSSFSIASLTLGNVIGGSEKELVVALTDGRCFFYDLVNKQELAAIRPVTTLNAFQTADLDGNGTAELLVLDGSSLKVFNPAGQLLWSVTGPNGYDLTVAQMDGDAALEIATSSGHVVDCGTRSVQWSRGSAFGAHLRAADIDADGKSELIAAEGWYNIWAFDIDLQTVKWSYRANLDISAIEVVNADADPELELAYGDNQHGRVHILSLGATTPVEEWSVPNPDSGIPRIIVHDIDDDGVNELVWGGGSNTTGEDHLHVFSTVTRQREWQSTHLDGPFVSPVIGDVTGDGVPELVTASWESDSGYGSGRILVFDLATRELLGMSNPIANDSSWTGLRDLKLRDVDQDGRAEIVVAADWLYDGIIEIYGFTDARTFTLKWANATRPSGAPYSQVEVLDIDGDGTLEVVAGNSRAHTGSSGTYVTVIDYNTKAVEWISPHMGGSWAGVKSLAVADVDGDGRVEAVAVTPGVGVFVYDLITRALEAQISGEYGCVVARAGQTGFHLGRQDGTVLRYTPNGAGGYTAAASWVASNSAITGLAFGAGQSLWIATGGRLYLWPDATGPIWASSSLGTVSPRVAVHATPQGAQIYAGLGHGIAGFQIGGGAGFTTASISAVGNLAEGAASEASLVFALSEPAASDLTLFFELGGSAVPGVDFAVSGAVAMGDRKYSVVVPSGASIATVGLTGKQDRTAEGLEQIRVTLSTGNGYFLGAPYEATVEITDDEPVLSVSATDATASELRSTDGWDLGEFTLARSGDLSRPLLVRYALEGTAQNGVDFRRIAKSVVFRVGASSAAVRILPRSDGVAEPLESVQLRILPAIQYLIGDESAASLTIADGEPVVSITGTTVLPEGVQVNFSRSGGHAKPLTVTVAVQSETDDGRLTISTRRFRFLREQSTGELIVSPAPRATSAAQVTVELVDNDRFHLGDSISVSFQLDPPAQ